MKKSWIIIGILVMFCVSTSNAAEHVVQPGEVIGIISQKTGCSVEHLAQLNDIDAPAYIVKQGQILRYVSDSDFEDAQKWVEARLEYNGFSQILEDIKARNIKYIGDKSTHAEEIILFAEMYRKQQGGE